MPNQLTLSAFKDQGQAGHRNQDLKGDLAVAFISALGCPHFQDQKERSPGVEIPGCFKSAQLRCPQLRRWITIDYLFTQHLGDSL